MSRRSTCPRTLPLRLRAQALHERKLPGAQEVACVCLIVSGCIIAGAGDLSYTPSGYATALLCASAQAVYILLAEANDRAKATGRHKGEAQRLGAAPMASWQLVTGIGGMPRAMSLRPL